MTRSLIAALSCFFSVSTAFAASEFVIHEDLIIGPDGMPRILFRDVVDDEDLALDNEASGVPADRLADRNAAVAAGKPYALPDVMIWGTRDAAGHCQDDCVYAAGWRTATPVATSAVPDLADAELMNLAKASLQLDDRTASRLVVRTYSVLSYLEIDPDQSSGRYGNGGIIRCRCVFNYLVDPKTGKVYAEVCNHCLLLVSVF